MIEKEDIFIDDNDKIEINVVGYKKRGESIIFSIGNKFMGVIDCYKKRDLFLTKKIIQDKKMKIDFLCWTHSDWDHTFGMAELKEFFDENTHIIVPSGFQAKEIRNFLEEDENRGYQYEEYLKILSIFDELDYEHYHTANQDSYYYSFSLRKIGSIGDSDKYDVKIYAFSPISKKIKEYNCNHIKSVYDKNTQWYENMNADNNLFSVGLIIEIGNKSKVNKICLTGDLNNETLMTMKEPIREKLFLKNTFLKIPHHGSKNSNLIFNFDNKKMKFNYAACTSFKSRGGTLPSDTMIDEYKKCGIVHRTNVKDSSGYGVIKYEIPIMNDDEIQVSLYGDADQC